MGAYHMAGVGAERSVERDDVRPAEQIIKRGVLVAKELREGGVGLWVEGEHFHAEAEADANDVEPDVSGADHSQRLSFEVEPLESLEAKVPLAGAHVGLMHVAREGEDERKGVLGYGVLAVSGHVRNENASLAGGCEVDMVETGRASGDEAKRGQGGDKFGRDARLDEGGQDLDATRELVRRNERLGMKRCFEIRYQRE